MTGIAQAVIAPVELDMILDVPTAGDTGLEPVVKSFIVG